MLTLKEMVDELINVDDIIWEQIILNKDPLIKKISSIQAQEFIKNAKECGINLARQLNELYPEKSIQQLIHENHINLIFNDDSVESAGYHEFASYIEPNKIIINKMIIEQALSAFESDDFSEVIVKAPYIDILMAHEFYHYIEYKNKDLYTTQKVIKSFSLGNFKIKSKVRMLGEIGAMSFAKEYLNLKLSPYLLNIILTYKMDIELANSVYLSVKEWLKDKGELYE